MYDLRKAFRRAAIAVGTFSLGLGLTACLGQDFLDLPLELTRFDHEWKVKVEPGEGFGVDLIANPLHLEAPWQLADFDPAVVEFGRSERITEQCLPTEENPCPEGIEDEPFLPHTHFGFRALTLGESPLRFELEVDGRVVDVVEYTLQVVEDACEGDVGIAANRCGLGDRQPSFGAGAIYEHGGSIVIKPGQTFDVTLAANTMHRDAPWQVAEVDTSILTLKATAQDPARFPGDWDTSDRDKPWHFLRIWRFTFEGTELGETPLVLEAVADGARIEIYEIIVAVVENAPDDV